MAVKEKVSYYRLKKAFNEIDPIESIVTEDDYNKTLKDVSIGKWEAT